MEPFTPKPDVTEAKLEKIKKRIEKMMALANHPNTPEAEREVASRQIEKLMTEFSLTEASLSFGSDNSDRGIFTMEYTHTDGYLLQKCSLLTVIASAIGVESISNLRWSGSRQVRSPEGTLVGTYDRIMLTWDLYVSIVDQLERERYVKADSSTRSQKSFMLGFTIEIRDRLQAHYKETINEMGEDAAKSAELVLVNDKSRIQKVIKDTFGEVKQAQARKVTVDPRSFEAGSESGRNADISMGNKVDQSKQGSLVQ